LLRVIGAFLEAKVGVRAGARPIDISFERSRTGRHRGYPRSALLRSPDFACAALCYGRDVEDRFLSTGAAVTPFAMGRGSAGPLRIAVFDMEGYSRSRTNTSAVLTFLAAWTSHLHAQGYKSGVYGNADSGISDLAAARGQRLRGARRHLDRGVERRAQHRQPVCPEQRVEQSPSSPVSG
jgi:Rv2525c-like, glycoside hydrolase-like domain